uniref:Peptidase S54 rhomboid domain-containing protein n=1 Tax=Dunaliella tertiolecta TaxID=3047 RepID=A0A7S3QN15_DUNTE|mmetsp:Transcript_14585/g.38668  ORF Transcript_14585/g.38668 Transcript_14585/m.38668 type:complete len:328 (+) Transcript_14585:70-1053(+)
MANLMLSSAKQGVPRDFLQSCVKAIQCASSSISPDSSPSSTSTSHSFHPSHEPQFSHLQLLTASNLSQTRSYMTSRHTCSPLRHGLSQHGSLRAHLELSHSQAGRPRGFFDISQVIQNLKYDFQDPSRSCTNSIILLNVAAWVTSLINPGILGRFAQSSYAIAKGEWWRLLTAPFLHGGITHLALNMLGVHLLAPPIEMACGRSVFILIYCLSGVGGGLAHHLMGSSNTYILGSSGAIAGLFTAFVVYKWRNRDHIGFTDADKSWVMQMVGLNVLLGLSFSGSLAHLAHIGGAVGGAATMWAFGPRFVREWGRVVDKPIIPLPKALQ